MRVQLQIHTFLCLFFPHAMFESPSLHQCPFSTTTNQPSIPPILQSNPSHPTSPLWQGIPICSLSLSFWVLWFAIEALSGHHVLSLVYFQHASPFPRGVSNLILLGVPFSIWDDFPPACEASFQTMAPTSWYYILLFLDISLLLCYFIFHRWVQSFYVCPSLSGSFHPALYSPCPSTLSKFHDFVSPNSCIVFHCLDAPKFL